MIIIIIIIIMITIIDYNNSDDNNNNNNNNDNYNNNFPVPLIMTIRPTNQQTNLHEGLIHSYTFNNKLLM